MLIVERLCQLKGKKEERMVMYMEKIPPSLGEKKVNYIVILTAYYDFLLSFQVILQRTLHLHLMWTNAHSQLVEIENEQEESTQISVLN